MWAGVLEASKTSPTYHTQAIQTNSQVSWLVGWFHSFPFIREILLDTFLGKTINGGSLLLHAPSHGSSVLSVLDDLGDGPDASGLAHVESTGWLGVRRQLVGVKDTTGTHQSGVSVLVQPFLALVGTTSAGTEHGLVLADALFGGHALLDGGLLFGLAGGVVGGRRESKGLPDGGDLGGSQIGLTDQRKFKGDSGKVSEASDLVGFLGGAVHSEPESVLVETGLEGGLADALLAVPEILETDSGSLEETEICICICNLLI
jgi:hypothetical protein